MRSIISIVVIVLISVPNVFSQIKTKRGTEILPIAGDFGIAIDAVPFLDYFGNFFNADGNEAPGFTFTSTHPAIITGKYVVNPNKYYRARARIGISSDKTNYKVQDDIATMSDPNSLATLDDELVVNSSDIYLGAGIEYRRGRGRLQGFFGPEAGVSMSSMTTKHNFANSFTASNTTPTSQIPGQAGIYPRTTEVKSGTTIGIGIRAFVGVEYFFAPLISVSGEFGWGILFRNTGEGSASTEEWDGIANEVRRKQINTGNAIGVGLDTDDANASLNLNFYF